MEELIHLQIILNNPIKSRSKSDPLRIRNYLSRIKFFENLKKEACSNDFINCCKHLKCKSYYCGEIICNNEEIIDRVFVILQGKVVFKTPENQVIRTYNQGSLFGENLINGKTIRNFGIYSDDYSILVYLFADPYRKYLFQYIEEKRLAMVCFLQAQIGFSLWNRTKIIELSNFLIETVYEKGFVLFNPGDPSKEIFIIVEGELVLIDKSARRLGAGEVVGLDDVRLNQLRSSTCVASLKTTLLVVSKYDFLNVNRSWAKNNSFSYKNKPKALPRPRSNQYLISKNLLYTQTNKLGPRFSLSQSCFQQTTTSPLQ